MNKLSAFEYVNTVLERFKNTNVYYTKNKSSHVLFLENTVITLFTIFILKYDEQKDIIIIRYTPYDYCSSIHEVQIKKSETVEHVFELFEWLVPKLTTFT